MECFLIIVVLCIFQVAWGHFVVRQNLRILEGSGSSRLTADVLRNGIIHHLANKVLDNCRNSLCERTTK